jgi:hypothetical protein
MKNRNRQAGRLYEVPCLIVIVLMGLALIVPPIVQHFQAHPGSEAAPVGSAAVGSGS